MPKITLKYIALNLMIAALYIIFAKIGFQFALKSPTITIFWPAGGFALAVILLWGIQYLPGIFIGSVIAGYMVVDNPSAALIIGIADLLETYIAFWLITRYFRINLALESIQDFWQLALLTGAIASSFSAIIGTTALFIGENITTSMYLQVCLRWWMGDLLGIAFITPLILIWSTAPNKFKNKWKVLELLALLAFSALIGLVVIFHWYQNNSYAPQGVAWLILLIAWSGFRFGKHITVLIQLAIFCFALWSASHNTGRYAADMLESGLFNFWLFGMVTALGGLAVAVMIDKSDKAHRALVEAVHYKRALLDNFPFMVWLKDTESRFLTVNKALIHASGVQSGDELIGKTGSDIYPPDLYKAFRRDDIAVMSSGQQKYIEKEVADKGVRKWHETYKAPVIDDDGHILGTVGFTRDITDRKQAEQLLLDSEKRFYSYFMKAPVGINGFDSNGKVIAVNSIARQYFGVSENDPLTNYCLFNDPSISDETKTKIRNGQIATEERFIDFKAIKNHHMYETKKTEDDRTLVHLTYTPYGPESNPAGYIVIIQDITERAQSEQKRLAHEIALRKTLIREVHHRIKNSLQGVTGLLNQTTAQYPELSDVITNVISQIRSISAVHGLQANNLHSKIVFQDLIRDIAENNRSLWSRPLVINIQANLPVWEIAEEESVTLALVLNELVLNAIKHSVARTEVQIELRADNTQNALLTISNAGQLSQNASSPHLPTKGTGLTLLEFLLPESGATLSWQQSGERVSARLTLAAPTITAVSKEDKS